MKLSFTGWFRNHGTKTMVSKVVNAGSVRNDGLSDFDSITIIPLNAGDHLFEGVELVFGTDMILGGCHQGRLRLSVRELKHLLNSCNQLPLGRKLPLRLVG